MEARRPEATSDLLAELAWVRRLARSLVVDAAAADDVAQDALLVTLEQPRGRIAAGAPLKAWLRGVLRRLALDRFREEKRRAEVEAGAAAHAPPRESPPQPFEIVARGARQERVTRAVMELEEPFRSTVLYRYLDELSTRDVATRMGVSEELVRKRLQRALQQLRARLDREFGESTGAWAAALLLPRIASASTASTASAIGASKAAAWLATGGLLMGTKLKVAAAVVVLSLVGTATWKFMRSPSRVTGQPVASSTTEPPKPTAATAEALASPAAERAVADRSESLTPNETTRGSMRREHLLHVRVVDLAGNACTQGVLDVAWDEQHSSPTGDTGRSRRLPIAGVVTDVPFPLRSQVATISASVADVPPAAPRSVRLARQDEDERKEVPREPIEQEVTLQVGASPPAPSLVGRILVDGVQRAPLGLKIAVGHRFAWLNVVTAEYAIGELQPLEFELVATSVETAPARFLRPPRDSTQTLDLNLTSGRQLDLHVVDDATSKPLAEFELYREIQAHLPIGARHLLTYENRAFVRTDARGDLRIEGLPIEGRLSIYRDAGTDYVMQSLGENLWRTVQDLHDPLWQLELQSTLPATMEHTLRIASTRVEVTVSGTLSPSLLTADPRLVVARAKATLLRALALDDGTVDPRAEVVPLDADGRFQFTSDARRHHKLWVEREYLRMSEVMDVVVEDVDVQGVVLRPRFAFGVTIRLKNVPDVGMLPLTADDEGAVRHYAIDLAYLGRPTEFVLPIEKPTLIHVGCGDEDGPTRLGQHWESYRIDPARQSELEIDLHGNERRTIELSVEGAPVKPRGTLVFQGTYDRSGTRRGSLEHLQDGRSLGPILLAPGRYFVTSTDLVDGLLATVLDVPSDGNVGPLHLRVTLAAHPLATLGRAIAVSRVEGFDLAAIGSQRFTLELGPGRIAGDVVYLPADCEFAAVDGR